MNIKRSGTTTWIMVIFFFKFKFAAFVSPKSRNV